MLPEKYPKGTTRLPEKSLPEEALLHTTYLGQITHVRFLGSERMNQGSKLTAGSAKNEIANTEKQEATIFPGQVLGTVSP